MLAKPTNDALIKTNSPRANLPFPKWLLGAALAVLLTAAAVFTLAFRPIAPAGSISQVDPAQMAAMQAAWGVRFTNVAVVAGGGFLDIRYQAIDPDKALALHDEDSLPVLIDQATGTVLDKGGSHAGHSDTMRAGSTYYLLYQNTGGIVRPGSRVTVKIGEVMLENLIVQ